MFTKEMNLTIQKLKPGGVKQYKLTEINFYLPACYEWFRYPKEIKTSISENGIQSICYTILFFQLPASALESCKLEWSQVNTEKVFDPFPQ